MQAHRPLLLTLALCAGLALSACASDDKQIEQKVALELESCRKAEGEFYEVRFESGKPYQMYRFACEAPVTDITVTEKINGDARVGPYEFKLRKNVSDSRWYLSQVRWPALDKARNVFTFDSISDSDYMEADKALAEAEAQAPKLAEIKERRLEIALVLRKKANKQDEPMAQRATLGPAQSYYNQALAAAKEHGDSNLEARLRVMALDYLNAFREKAEENSTPSESAAEWEAAAIKAVQNDADEAKKKGDTATYDKKMAEIEQRKKEAEQNVVKREKAAAEMAEMAKLLKAEQCKEISAAKGLAPTDTELRNELTSALGAVTCP